MAKAAYYPLANRTAQDFSKTHPGVPFTSLRLLVLHTTEGGSWPAYSGGLAAPHFTALPDVANRKLVFRQHFPVTMSARALLNPSGGVQTNNDRVVQIELVGTSEKGGPGMYWPEAPDWSLQDLADFVKWLNAEWDIPMQSTVRWVAYPASYGVSASQRLSATAWTNYRGILGHQHVPENDHGDPGLFPIARLLEFTKEDDLPLTDADKKFITDTVKAQVDARADVIEKTINGYVNMRLRDFWEDAWVHNPPMKAPTGTIVGKEEVQADGSKWTAYRISPLGMINEVFRKVDTEVDTVNARVTTLAAQVDSLTKAVGGVSDLGDLQEKLGELVAIVQKLVPTQPTS